MRLALNRLRDSKTVALIGHGTAAHEFVLRGAQRQDTPQLVLWCYEPSQRSSAARVDTRQSHLDTLRTDLWPDSLTRGDAIAALPADVGRTPQRDRATIAWADEVIVLALRTRGNLHSLLRERLHKPHACVLLADLPGLQARQARIDLLELGAKTWTLPVAQPDRQVSAAPGHEPQPDGPRVASQQRVIPCPPAAGWDYLTHTTRACAGPWPGQSRDDYLDSLLDRRSDADHSALRTLLRIVAQRRLIGSSLAIRGGFRVVSLSAVPLAELPRLHVFRAHRARWDFEPYGICISRSWLRQHAVRPVRYAGESEWDRLSAIDRTYFQHLPHLDTPIRPGSALDWSVEQEWRHVGDLDLSNAASHDALLFVPSLAEARMLLEFSPWPVTVLGTQ
jgi:hypothetical protein